MTVTLVVNPQHYVGVAADSKPTDCKAGATFIERDTGSKYIFDGSTWGLTEVLNIARTVVDEAVIDEGEAVWTNATDLITIAPATGYPLQEASLYLDLAKASTGFSTGYDTETVTFAVARKVDGTNWSTTQTLSAITGSTADGVTISLGIVGVTEQAKVTATLSAENDGSTVAEIPFVLTYLAGSAPTVTAAEAGA